jgi:hypothetical protein
MKRLFDFKGDSATQQSKYLTTKSLNMTGAAGRNCPQALKKMVLKS